MLALASPPVVLLEALAVLVLLGAMAGLFRQFVKPSIDGLKEDVTDMRAENTAQHKENGERLREVADAFTEHRVVEHGELRDRLTRIETNQKEQT